MAALPLPALLLILGLATAVAALLGGRGRGTRGSRGPWLAAIHPLLVAVLFFSLAVHMYWSLDGWPRGNGSERLSDGLVLHTDATLAAFESLLLALFVAVPCAVALCAAAPRWRGALRALGVYQASGLAALGAMMLLAPDPFLLWWWD